MPGGGSKPGERRGGRKKGSLNFKTRIRLAEEAQGGRVVDDSPVPMAATIGTPLREVRDTSTLPLIVSAEKVDPLGREVLNTFMKIYMGRAAFFQPKPKVGPDGKPILDPQTGKAIETNGNASELLFDKYAQRAVDTASKLAPYQSPQYRAIFIAPPPAQANGSAKKRYSLTVIDNHNGRTIQAEVDSPERAEEEGEANGRNGDPSS